MKKNIQIIKNSCQPQICITSIWDRRTQTATELKYTSGWIESLCSHHLIHFLTYMDINCGKHNRIMTRLQLLAANFIPKNCGYQPKNIFSNPLVGSLKVAGGCLDSHWNIKLNWKKTEGTLLSKTFKLWEKQVVLFFCNFSLHSKISRFFFSFTNFLTPKMQKFSWETDNSFWIYHNFSTFSAFLPPWKIISFPSEWGILVPFASSVTISPRNLSLEPWYFIWTSIT